MQCDLGTSTTGGLQHKGQRLTPILPQQHSVNPVQSLRRRKRPYAAAHSASLDIKEPSKLNRDGNGHHSDKLNGELKIDQLENEESEAEKYDWQKAWYPVGIERNLPTDRPTAVRLLGNAIVLWKDGEQKWRAFQDLCPHRLVPLSEGRVEDGELMCSYHGWRFRGEDGRATAIPQADDEQSFKTATESRRSCCTTYPCEVHEGLIWVYGSSGPRAFEESKTVDRAASPKMEDPDFVGIPGWFMRELPYGADVLCENVIDPAHVPHSHHGVQGNRYKAQKMVMDPVKEIRTQQGFKVHVRPPQGEKRFEYDLAFQPPTCVRYELPQGMELITHAVPTDPGRSKIFFTTVLPKSRLKGIASLLIKIKMSKWLVWTDHFNRNALFDGDSVFLALQDEELRRRLTREASRNYFMPASLDFGVQGLRQWATRHASPVPWGAGAYPEAHASDLPRRQLLDRFEQHTKHCKSCATAHKVFSISKWVGTFAAVFMAAYAAFTIGNGMSAWKAVGPTVLAAVFGAIGGISQRFKHMMEFTDYRRVVGDANSDKARPKTCHEREA